jgi:iron complex outermembrane recepter protein
MEKIFKMVMLIGILITFLALALPAIGMAEEEVNQEEKTLELNKMVVTATRMEKDVDSAPGNVTVVSKEDMKFRDIHTIDDVLKFESGIYNGQLRGTPNEAHTLVVVNGKPLNTGWYGHVRWDNIAIGDVERIEIIRGPASALYGGNAMGGVINIITSTPKEFEAGVAVGYGSDDTSRYSLYVGDRFADKLSLRVGYEFEETDGYPSSLVRSSIKSGSGTVTGGYETLDTSGGRKWVVGDYGDNHEKRWNINLNAVYDLTDTGSLAFDFQTGHTETAKGRPHTYLRDASGNPTFSGSVDAGNGEKVTVSPSDFLTSGITEIETPSYMLTYRESFGSIDFIGKVGYQKEDY